MDQSSSDSRFSDSENIDFQIIESTHLGDARAGDDLAEGAADELDGVAVVRRRPKDVLDVAVATVPVPLLIKCGQS